MYRKHGIDKDTPMKGQKEPTTILKKVYKYIYTHM